MNTQTGFWNKRKRQTINIWAETPCDSRVKLTAFIPAQSAKRIGCIICPGGSYFWLAKKTEGIEVAKWLNQNGIAAFVLEYRVGGIPAFMTGYRLTGKGRSYPNMLQDVQRAIQIVRENCDAFQVDNDKIGVMGFSAGGHLSMMSGIFYDSNVLALTGVHSNVTLRPNFIASLYPVVSLIEKCAHRRSRRGLLGERNLHNTSMRERLSLERQIRNDLPPVFLMNCKDDPTVHYHNSELLHSSLTLHDIPHKYLQYTSGGHGFGISESKTNAEAIQWKACFMEWINSLF